MVKNSFIVSLDTSISDAANEVHPIRLGVQISEFPTGGFGRSCARGAPNRRRGAPMGVWGEYHRNHRNNHFNGLHQEAFGL